MKRVWTLLLLALLPVCSRAAEPPVALQLGSRNGLVTPDRAGYTHTAGGNILVSQPTPDVLVITMTGVVVASGHPFYDSRAALNFDLTQDLKVVFNDQKLKKAHLEMEARVIGLLRSDVAHHSQTSGNVREGCHEGCGSAEQGAACASLTSGALAVATVCVDPHAVSCGEYLSLNCQSGPCSVPVGPGCYSLHETFHLQATHPRTLLPCHPASAEFAPDALDPTWISYWEPFRGANKKDFGFQVVLRVMPD